MGAPDYWCPKHTIEVLSTQQTHAPDAFTRAEFGRLLSILELHRPVASNCKHGDLHTPTCGCDLGDGEQ